MYDLLREEDMATIKLTDQFGLDLDVQPADTSALLKYAGQIPTLRLQDLDLKKVGGLTLDQPALTRLATGIAFQDPLTLGAGAPALTVAAGVSGSIQLLRDAKDLPAHDDPIELAADECYVAFAIEATASTDISGSSGVLQFGAAPSSLVEAASYSRFPLKTGVTLIDAVRQTVGNFLIPLRCSDLSGLGDGQIARVALSGKLAISGSANLLAITNPLASASLPAPLPGVSVTAGGSVTVGVSCTILAGYEVLARKLDNGAVRLGWYRKKGTEYSVSARASEGISASVGATDVVAQLIGAISASPKADLAELSAAGVPDAQASAIAEAVKAAACRNVELAISLELSAADSDAAAFLYDIVPSALNDQSQTAVDQALRGDLTGLHAAGLAGVTPVRSVWDKVRQRSVELGVNVLGILNYRSVTALALDGQVLYEPATGALVITDRATAERIRSTQVNFGADTQKLRHVLAESFLITAAYHAATLVQGASLQCSHSFFELQNSTSRDDVVRKLNIGVALGLLSPDEANAPDGVSVFGRTLFSVSTNYNNELLQRMFLDGSGTPVPRETYESAGRKAIQLLVQPDDADAVRRQPALDDDLWRQMTATGQPGFAGLFPGVAAPLVGAITADYSTIEWWADAMRNTAQQLAEVQRWTSQHPAAPADDSEFQNLREKLAGYLRNVAANTREEFGQPWGLLAMNQLATRPAGGRIVISGPAFVKDKRRELAADTSGASEL